MLNKVTCQHRWNFSVGEHEVLHISASKRQRPEQAAEISDESRHADAASASADDDEIRIETCDDGTGWC